jgi:flagellar hook-basal body complex protein FliE
MSISRVGSAGELGISSGELTLTDPTATTGASGGAIGAEARPDFSSVLEQQVMEASRLDHIAAVKSDALARGASDDLHGTMISLKEADISMKLVGTVRNRLLDAFHELWRINL